jgi:glycosyltransferase involved in cell wall biosynthesis
VPKIHPETVNQSQQDPANSPTSQRQTKHKTQTSNRIGEAVADTPGPTHSAEAKTPAPGVSIIMPVYNAKDIFDQTRASITAQTFTDFELLLVNDGSTDADSENSTEKRLAAWAKVDPRVKVFTQTNQGAGVARNLGLDNARGRYLWIIDSDDFFEPDCLELMVEAADNTNADYVLVESDRYRESTKRFTPARSGFLDGWFPPYQPFNWREIAGNLFESQIGWSWDKLFRRDFIETNHLRFQALRSSNDLSFVYSAVAYSELITTIDRPLVHYRVETQSSVSKTRDAHPENFFLALMDLKKNLERKNLSPEINQLFLDYALRFILWQLKTLGPEARQFCINNLNQSWNRDIGIEQTPAANFVEEAQYWEYMELLK